MLIAATPTAAMWLIEMIGFADPGTTLRFAAALPLGAVTSLWLAAIAGGNLR